MSTLTPTPNRGNETRYLRLLNEEKIARQTAETRNGYLACILSATFIASIVVSFNLHQSTAEQKAQVEYLNISKKMLDLLQNPASIRITRQFTDSPFALTGASYTLTVQSARLHRNSKDESAVITFPSVAVLNRWVTNNEAFIGQGTNRRIRLYATRTQEKGKGTIVFGTLGTKAERAQALANTFQSAPTPNF